MSEIDRRLNGATRQYRHNDDNSGSTTNPEQGFVIAYDRKEIDKLVALLAAGQGEVKPAVPDEWRESLQELVDAMIDYGMIVDDDPPNKHRAMMARAMSLLAAAPQPGEGDNKK